MTVRHVLKMGDPLLYEKAAPQFGTPRLEEQAILMIVQASSARCEQ